jgi:hypothetical protein
MTNYTKLTDFASKDTLPTGNAAKIVKGTEIDDEFEAIETAVATKANINSPTFTGTPAAPTAAASVDTTQVATTAFVKDVVTSGGYVTTAGIADDAITAAKLADTAVTADTYGDASNIPQITVDAQGRLTNATEVAVTIPTMTFASLSTSFGNGTTYDLVTDTYILSGTAFFSGSGSAGGRLDVQVYDSTSGTGTLLQTFICGGFNELNGTDGGSGMSGRDSFTVLLPPTARSIKLVRADGNSMSGQLESYMTFTGYHS